MLLTPDRSVVKQLKRYDERLFVKWNNEDQWFEVWYKTLWGDRLITPVTKSIYDVKAEIAYTPLDHRIVEWLFLADSQRRGLSTNDTTKYLCRKAKRELICNNEKQAVRQKIDFKNRAKDNYYSMKPWSTDNILLDEKDWEAPDVKGTRSRTSSRSAESVRRQYDIS